MRKKQKNPEYTAPDYNLGCQKQNLMLQKGIWKTLVSKYFF